eukprot:CAMPEP_0198110846 /NCGR_PEP_ID=MMETSP1442-20131203/2844_1 /TAXON_ID= /ORGANISM="Craspedostauros australis, Strain CCMP3328" /LENGTH=218 /DNA_ID=CAMNT_0043767061 /DNA_START=56 /DNA_END=712 /DNA_ORIENTATION=-
MNLAAITLLALACVLSQTSAFAPQPLSTAQRSQRVSVAVTSNSHDGAEDAPNRRQFLKNAFLASAIATATSTTLLSDAPVASASGGATAGGAYLLSAKQRYNERVTKSIQALIVAQTALEGGDSGPAKAYFSGDETGTWKDITTAGYLLSNAFRRNSTTAPDSLPAVKKWKAFVVEVDAYQKLLKKKGGAVASDAFPKVEAALQTWLEEVDLPPPREL